jgi:hypothetical protein
VAFSRIYIELSGGKAIREEREITMIDHFTSSTQNAVILLPILSGDG